ncbi:11434_t:CDS:2, partial [Scutellospora calospora]
DRIAVWVRDKDNVSVINGIGRRLLKILDLQNEKGIGMDFQFNEDALKSGTSYNNRVYLSLESLKQELENEEKARLEELAKSAKRQSLNFEDFKANVTVSTPDIVTIDVDAEIDAANAKIKLTNENNKENDDYQDDNHNENNDNQDDNIEENGDYQDDSCHDDNHQDKDSTCLPTDPVTDICNNDPK